MTDTFTMLGVYALGECIPLGVAAVAAAEASLAVSVPDLEARLAGALAAQVRVTSSPPTIAAQIELAQSLIANLQAMVSMPAAAVTIGAMGAVIAELRSVLGGLQVQAGIVAGLSALLGTPGVYVVHYTGSDEGVIPGGLPGVSVPVEGVIILGADSGAIQAIRSALKVS